MRNLWLSRLSKQACRVQACFTTDWLRSPSAERRSQSKLDSRGTRIVCRDPNHLRARSSNLRSTPRGCRQHRRKRLHTCPCIRSIHPAKELRSLRGFVSDQDSDPLSLNILLALEALAQQRAVVIGVASVRRGCGCDLGDSGGLRGPRT